MYRGYIAYREAGEEAGSARAWEACSPIIFSVVRREFIWFVMQLNLQFNLVPDDATNHRATSSPRPFLEPDKPVLKWFELVRRGLIWLPVVFTGDLQ
jgi:hypothetical protein